MEKYSCLVNKMNEFVSEPTKQTAQFALEITASQEYKDFMKSLSPNELATHETFRRFLEKSNAIIIHATAINLRAKIESGQG